MDKSLILKEIKLHLGLKNDVQFADFLGIKPNVLSAWYRRNTFDIDILYTKCRDISPDWLLTGSGEMLRNQNIQNPSTTSDTHTENTAKPSQNQREDTHSFDIKDYRKKLPLYNAEAAAGFGSFSEFLSDDLIIDHYDIPEFQSADFLIYINGNSMTPKYVNGDIVACKIIHEPQFIQWGRPHVLVTRNQGLLCKRLYSSLSGSEEHIQVYSEDTKYEPFDIPREEIYGYALVIGVIHHE